MGSWGVPTRHIRIVVQGLVFALWVALIWATQHPLDSALLKFVPASLFLRMNPLVATVVLGSARIGVTILFLAAITWVVTVVLGRVFCGWVCPLGTIFDAYGWVLKKFRVNHFGPSPSWFRFKYYLLIAILAFAVFGGISPLMGFDPIVLLTRTVASVIQPLGRKWADWSLAPGSSLGMHGDLVNLGTLFLFMGIMGATTKVSRIWCRTACPLGAYLGVMSRHSALRRQTEGCVHCNICSNHCPTGAIHFSNAEFYNESECIKCFACSEVCPVDANFFALTSPLPAVTEQYAPVQLDRRAAVATLAGAAIATPGLHLSGGDPGEAKNLIRPPMSREEKDFLQSCIRCGECVKVCPSGILKPAGFEHGLRALWTPVMVATEGACVKGCNACSEVCPTDAILKYPIEQKYSYKAGTAVFESSLCISHTEGKFCLECVRACPTNAITFERGWEPEGSEAGRGADVPAPAGQKPSRPLGIRFEACVGCGGCENACSQVVYGEPAMVTTSFGRATATTLAANEGGI